MPNQGRLVILSGPSGVGKDTLINAWKVRNARVERVVAYTTRDPRPGEADGIDYHFVSPHEFREKAEKGDFLEWKQVHGNFYATPLTDMNAMLEAGKIAILKIDVQGALDVMELRKDALSIFILPPSTEELEHRIRSRAQDAPHEIEKRLQNARDELAESDKYQFRVVNDDLMECIDLLETIVAPSRLD